MKLRNKKTGEIMAFDAILPVKDVKGDSVAHLEYNSLAELNEEWEDYEDRLEHYYILHDGDIVRMSELVSSDLRKNNIEIGNYFDTREEAEKAVEKLKAWKRLKDKGFKFNGYEHMMSADHKQRVYVDWFIPLDYEKYIPDLDLLFSGGEE